MNKLINNSLKSGTVLGLILSTYSLILFLSKINIFGVTFSIFNFIVLLLIMTIFLSMNGKAYRRSFDGGYITYGQAFVNLLLTGIFASIFISIFQFILHKMGDFSYLKTYINNAVLQYEKMGISSNKLDEIYKLLIMSINQTPFEYATDSLVSYITSSLILSLIIAIFIKKNKPMFDIS